MAPNEEAWIHELVRAGVDSGAAERCCQLFRTVAGESFHAAAHEIWVYKEGAEHGIDLTFDLPFKKLDPNALKTELNAVLRQLGAEAAALDKVSTGVREGTPAGSTAQLRGPDAVIDALRRLSLAEVKVMGKPAQVNAHPDLAAEQGAGSGGLATAEDDRGAGALCLSHAWDAPEGWEKHFGGGQVFEGAKQLQASTAIRRAAARELQRPDGRPARVWVDMVSVPPPVSPSDHPLEQTVWGPIRLPIKEMKSIIPKVDGPNSGYTILRLASGHKFNGTMQIRTFDELNRPSKNATPREICWELPLGEYHVHSAHVIPEDKFSPSAASERRTFRPGAEQLRCWCSDLVLRDDIWVEMTLGSLRCEYLLLTECMLAMQGGLVVVATWNYFDRLWPLVEWSIFCARRGPDRIQLAADALAGPTLVEYHRAVRRVSVTDAGCRDPRDRELLLELLERVFRCEAQIVTLGYSVPAPTHSCAAFNNNCQACKSHHRRAGARARNPAYTVTAQLLVGDRPVNLRDVSVPERERVVDYSSVERYVRATAVAVFAREQAHAASGARSCDDEGGWTALCKELGMLELHGALKRCKPYDWWEHVSGLGLEGMASEDAYAEQVEEWWESWVMPALAGERTLAVR